MADDSKVQDTTANVDSVAVVLKEIKCCSRCVFRFLGEKNSSLYQNSEEVDVKLPCIACLAVLEKKQEKSFIDKIHSSIRKAGHQFDSFMLTISLPLSIILRQHSVSLFLQEHHSSIFDKKMLSETPSVKEVFKWVYGPIVEELLQVDYMPLSPFKISLVLTHKDNDKELEFLNSSSKTTTRQRQKRQKMEASMTAPSVKKALAELTAVSQLKRLADCPPQPAALPIELSEVVCFHDSIYIAGRYNKFSRVLSQTPWIIDNVRHTESSVEEKICDRIRNKIKADDHKFASAGREDIDVLMLGRGRPFLVEFINPRVTRLSESFLSDLQQEINSSTTEIFVRDLQQVTKDDCQILKDAESNKTKTYKALIWTKEEIVEKHLHILQDTKDLIISQKTPLRVLHRRPLASEQIDAHHFNLFLKTQAGTYIKEFVHGDFGRTKPNLGQLLNTETDILQLDVESVDVDWPPRKDEIDDQLKDSS
ncbi:putative tRNA pseudouridine synthase Pus10 [Porites harrisoni]